VLTAHLSEHSRFGKKNLFDAIAATQSVWGGHGEISGDPSHDACEIAKSENGPLELVEFVAAGKDRALKKETAS